MDIVEHGENGYLCNTGSLESYLAKLKMLLSDEILLSKYRQDSLIKSKAFDINCISLFL